MSYFITRSTQKRIKDIGTFVLALAMVFQTIGPGVFELRTARAAVQDSVTICHATSSNSNPYVSQSPNIQNDGSLSGGHLNHVGGVYPTNDWGDIIPPYTSGNFVYPGMNWSSAGQAIYNNGCSVFPKITVTKTVVNTGGGTKVANDFNLKVDNIAVLSGVALVSTVGSHTVSETNLPNYTAGVWGGDCDANGQVNLSYGDNKTCTITNTYVSPGGPNIQNTCIDPTTQGGTKITSFGIPNGGENTLQTVLTNAGYTINTVADETGVQAWNIPLNTQSVTLDVKYIKALASNKQEVGYYFDGNISTYVPLFKQAGHTGTGTVLAEGGSVTSVVINTTGHTSIGFALNTQGSSPAKYATQFSLNALNEDHVVVYNTSSNKYVIGFEDLPFSFSDKDYQDMVIEVKIVSCESGSQCVPTSGTVNSDATVSNTTDGGTAVPLSFIHPAWTASIPGATWIWATDPVVSPTNDGDLTKVFTKTFTITGNPTGGTLDVAADNSYIVKVNGTVVPVVFDNNNFQLATQDSYDIGAFLNTGSNTLEITVTNKEDAGQSPNPANNPAGLMFALSWRSDCDGGNGGPNELPKSKVTLHKYVDGALATNGTFSVDTQATWNDGVAHEHMETISLSNPSYSGVSIGMTNEYNSFSATEVTGGTSNILPIGVACQPGKYRLVGYSYGNDIASAIGATINPGLNLQNINADKDVIVWNETCPTSATVIATKIVCTDEADLPNRGDGIGNPYPITSTTATDWITAHESCSLQPDWTFQWAPSGTANPGDNNMSVLGAWITSGLTAFNGNISINIPIAENGNYVWMREVPKVGYLSFSGDVNGNNGWDDNSAEFYCGTDVLNYDNYDRVDNMIAGETYHCVAWNVPIVPDVCPNIEGVQVTIPQGYHDEDGQCVIDNNGGGGNPTPDPEDPEDQDEPEGTPTLGSHRRGGTVAGASTSNSPAVLGASTDLPDLPDTGNGEDSQVFMIILALMISLLALNTFAISKMKNN